MNSAQILLRLKPRLKALGFNQKELKGIASLIADNLELDDSASEDDANAAIDEKIEAVAPFLGFGQSQANRLLEEWKKNHPGTVNALDSEPVVADDKSSSGVTNGEKTTPADSDVMPAWAQKLMNSIESLTGDVNSIKLARQEASRKERLEAALNGTGSYGQRSLKNFSRMRFDSDDDFDQYLTEVEADVKSWRQEMADAGLKSMAGSPAATPLADTGQPLSDKELDEMAASM